MSWRWATSQQLEVSVIPSGEHQRSRDELCVIWELDAECPRSHELVWTDLERFSYPSVPLLTSRRQIF
jgi:hypothetical protein